METFLSLRSLYFAAAVLIRCRMEPMALVFKTLLSS